MKKISITIKKPKNNPISVFDNIKWILNLRPATKTSILNHILTKTSKTKQQRNLANLKRDIAIQLRTRQDFIKLNYESKLKEYLWDLRSKFMQKMQSRDDYLITSSLLSVPEAIRFNSMPQENVYRNIVDSDTHLAESTYKKWREKTNFGDFNVFEFHRMLGDYLRSILLNQKTENIFQQGKKYSYPTNFKWVDVDYERFRYFGAGKFLNVYFVNDHQSKPN